MKSVFEGENSYENGSWIVDISSQVTLYFPILKTFS